MSATRFAKSSSFGGLSPGEASPRFNGEAVAKLAGILALVSRRQLLARQARKAPAQPSRRAWIVSGASPPLRRDKCRSPRVPTDAPTLRRTDGLLAVGPLTGDTVFSQNGKAVVNGMSHRRGFRRNRSGGAVPLGRPSGEPPTDRATGNLRHSPERSRQPVRTAAPSARVAAGRESRRAREDGRTRPGPQGLALARDAMSC